MKKNRIVPRKMNVTAATSISALAVVLVLFLMVIVNHLASSSCTQLQKSIGRKRLELAKLENERLREDASWRQMITPVRLEAALRSHGMKMLPMHESQIVRMGRNGKPNLGQVSVALAQERKNAAVSRTAQYAPGRRSVKR